LWCDEYHTHGDDADYQLTPDKFNVIWIYSVY
jgi:hypothetical protein